MCCDFVLATLLKVNVFVDCTRDVVDCVLGDLAWIHKPRRRDDVLVVQDVALGVLVRQVLQLRLHARIHVVALVVDDVHGGAADCAVRVHFLQQFVNIRLEVESSWRAHGLALALANACLCLFCA